jgi:DNA-directed RNA polymerase specialized sigma subunit
MIIPTAAYAAEPARYAVPSILGALTRQLRDTAWGMQVPRPTQELAREVAAATGAKVGLSQMHVSRLLRRSLARLRAGLPGRSPVLRMPA